MDFGNNGTRQRSLSYYASQLGYYLPNRVPCLKNLKKGLKTFFGLTALLGASITVGSIIIALALEEKEDEEDPSYD